MPDPNTASFVAALAVVLSAISATPVHAQQTPQVDLGDVVRAALKKPPTSANRSPDLLQISFLPTLSSNPAIGVGIGAVVTGASRRGGADTSLSSAQISFVATTKDQLILSLRNDMHSRDDRWGIVGDAAYAKFVQQTFGLGSNTTDDVSVQLHYTWIRAYETVYRRIKGPLHIGAGYHLDSYRNITPQDDVAIPPEVAEKAHGTTTASGLSANLLYDSRDNSLNASRGVFGRMSLFYYPEALGSSRPWRSIQFEGRGYRRLPSTRRQVLTAWTQAWLTLDGHPPYLSLPSVGWDTYGRTARSYAAGRFRGRDWVYAETEYRVDLMQNGLLGAVVFVNGSTLSDNNSDYGRWVAGVGTGLRLKLDKHYGTNLAIDFAMGREGSRGVWFGLNEAF